MGATVNLTKTINFVRPFLNWASLTIGDSNEPALTAANLTLQTIVGPPFVWPWNRTTISFMASESVQDYNVALSDFGFLESATLQLAGVITQVSVSANVATFSAINNFSSLLNNGQGATVVTSGCTTSAYNGRFTILAADAESFTVELVAPGHAEAESGAIALCGPIMPLELKWGSLGEAIEEDRPSFISTQASNESGVSFSFRLMPIPNTTYKVILTYQQAPTILTVPSDTWQIPDQLQYLYTYFFMFLMMDYFDDPRSARYRQLAVAGLLARQKGLSETDRNLFIGNWLPLMQEEQSSTDATSQAAQARGI